MGPGAGAGIVDLRHKISAPQILWKGIMSWSIVLRVALDLPAAHAQTGQLDSGNGLRSDQNGSCPERRFCRTSLFSCNRKHVSKGNPTLSQLWEHFWEEVFR
jgi:hypothetical protein